MYADVRFGITCCFCSLLVASFVNFSTPIGALKHLAEHRRAGHKVPQDAIDQLFDEIWEEEIE